MKTLTLQSVIIEINIEKKSNNHFLNFKDFEKLDGYSIFTPLLNHNSPEVRALTCELAGICAQNNPYCQKTLLASKILPLLFYKIDKDTSDEVRIKALFAVSCKLEFINEKSINSSFKLINFKKAYHEIMKRAKKNY